MADKGRGDTGVRCIRVAVYGAVAVGVLVLMLLHPASGIDTQPPECYAVFGYVVPCGSGFSLGFAVLGAVAASTAICALAARRRGRQGHGQRLVDSSRPDLAAENVGIPARKENGHDA